MDKANWWGHWRCLLNTDMSRAQHLCRKLVLVFGHPCHKEIFPYISFVYRKLCIKFKNLLGIVWTIVTENRKIWHQMCSFNIFYDLWGNVHCGKCGWFQQRPLLTALEAGWLGLLFLLLTFPCPSACNSCPRYAEEGKQCIRELSFLWKSVFMLDMVGRSAHYNTLIQKDEKDCLTHFQCSCLHSICNVQYFFQCPPSFFLRSLRSAFLYALVTSIAKNETALLVKV